MEINLSDLGNLQTSFSNTSNKIDLIHSTSSESSNDSFSKSSSKWRKQKRGLTFKGMSSNIPNETNKSIINYETPAGIKDIERDDVPNPDDNVTKECDQIPKKAREIVANPMKWKCNTRKIAYQKGKSYTSKRGKNVPERTVKTLKNCNLSCKFKCGEKISDTERSCIHDSYYSLESATEKRHFLINTTSRLLTARPKTPRKIKQGKEEMDKEKTDIEMNGKNVKSTRREFSFKYFFIVKGVKIQVCKSFYLGTLSISQKPVYTAHSTKNIETNTPTRDQRGMKESSRRVPKGDHVFATEHIKSFPVVESHYCRVHAKREYLGSDLNIRKMFEMYLQKCAIEKISPVRKSMYYRIFVTKFNFGFQSPKSGGCDLCEKFSAAKQTKTLTDSCEYDVHQTSKINMQEVRKEEKKNNLPTLLFDLQNVITTPQAHISSLLYLYSILHDH